MVKPLIHTVPNSHTGILSYVTVVDCKSDNGGLRRTWRGFCLPVDRDLSPETVAAESVAL